MAKTKILLLEDDSNLNETVTEFLEEEGYVVESAYDGYEAQDRLYESKYDLLLLDVNTPGIDGFTLLKDARENGVVAPAIFAIYNVSSSFISSIILLSSLISSCVIPTLLFAKSCVNIRF